MDQRKRKILDIIIKEHIRTGLPVGSSVLVNKYGLDVSPATVRNDMVDLENDKYVIQPHVSAGRIPTEKAYKLFVSQFLGESGFEAAKGLSEKDKTNLLNKLGNLAEKDFKTTAKELARLSDNAVFWAMHKHNLFYTGISNLFQQPEFAGSKFVYDFSAVIDSMDDIIDCFFDGMNFGAHVFIGSDNPFGDFCGTVVLKYKHKNNIGMVGVLGPIRMCYDKDLALLDFIDKQLK